MPINSLKLKKPEGVGEGVQGIEGVRRERARRVCKNSRGEELPSDSPVSLKGETSWMPNS